ncbi:hypothetical protein CSAL01_12166 [Colletotrichum salicis]|uniref:Uncharacterized protein n=1 Tax=Colletotrichum salicis TaxID=1209931 RepID=A0A135TBV9_9PEZI|nr:hypothetical protein CSAL01_12166 [Colletotrichum salicis]
MSSASPRQGQPQGSRAGEKRKAPDEYSDNPNTVRFRKRVDNMTEAEREVHKRHITMNTRFSREFAKLKKTTAYQIASPSNQARQKDQLRQANEEYYIQKGNHPSQTDTQAGSSSDPATFDDLSDTEMGIDDEEQAIDTIEDGIPDEDASAPSHIKSMDQIAEEYHNKIRKQLLVVSYTTFRSNWLATLEILWAKLATFYRFPSQVDKVLRLHGRGAQSLPLAQSFLSTEEIFLCSVLHFFWDPTIAKDTTKPLGELVTKVHRRRAQTFKRSAFWKRPAGLILYTKRKSCYSYSIPVRKMIRDILYIFEEHDDWVSLPGPAGIWRKAHLLSEADFRVLRILFDKYGNKLAVIAEYLEMPPIKDRYPSSWETFDTSLLDKVFTFNNFST